MEVLPESPWRWCSEKKCGKRVSCHVPGEIEASPRDVGRSAVQGYPAIIESGFHRVRAGGDRDVVVDLVYTIAVESVATITLGGTVRIHVMFIEGIPTSRGVSGRLPSVRTLNP